MRSLYVAIVLTAVVPAEGAYFQTGKDLDGYCRSGSSFCLGYIAGVVDTLFLTANKQQICIPREVRLGRVTDVVRQYLDDYPELHEQPAETLVWAALVGTWPCL